MFPKGYFMSDSKKAQAGAAYDSVAGINSLKPSATVATVAKSFAGVQGLQTTPLASVVHSPVSSAPRPVAPTPQGFPSVGGTASTNANPRPNPAPNKSR